MQGATQNIKAYAEEVKDFLVAGIKLSLVLGPILVGATLGLPRFTPIEMLAVGLVVLGVTLGVFFLRKA